ncbi:hypothetical protein OG474_01240 [Kribbella sp. NBC_01505]|uniref:hypothetical protein n=1 Tax=Kribbella sp. NBC_01505 TaxID=2903580 RepID=UPI00386502D8
MTGDTREFLAAFREAASGTPTGLIAAWTSFVDQAEAGYSDNIYEFRNDLSVRGRIEKLLGSAELQGFEQMGWVRAEIAEVDERYRALLIEVDGPAGRGWWEAGVPRVAGAELAADFAEQYGIEVAVIE